MKKKAVAGIFLSAAAFLGGLRGGFRMTECSGPGIGAEAAMCGKTIEVFAAAKKTGKEAWDSQTEAGMPYMEEDPGSRVQEEETDAGPGEALYAEEDSGSYVQEERDTAGSHVQEGETDAGPGEEPYMEEDPGSHVQKEGTDTETGEERDMQTEIPDIQSEADDLLSDLGLSEMDDYLSRESHGSFTFSGLVRELMSSGLTLDFASAGETLRQAVWNDYAQNRSVLIQVLTLSIAFSVLVQMTSALQKNYIPDLGFLGIYLILMMLLLRLFLIVEGITENYLAKLTEFMQLLQPAFCMSMVFSNGSISAGAYYQLLLLLIYLADLVFTKILLPVVQIHMVLQLLNHLTEERFSKIAALLADSVDWCIKIMMTALIGLNIVQGLLAPGIDGLKRSAAAGALQAVPGAGQIMNAMTEILAGSAMLVKNSVGVAALVILVMISFLPLVKAAVFMLLYRGCAALMEPVSDKRFCAAVSALGQSAALCLKLMFYAALLFFLTTAVICASTTLAKVI